MRFKELGRYQTADNNQKHGIPLDVLPVVLSTLD